MLHILMRILIILLLFFTFKAMAYEEAIYNVVYQNDFYEIRNYNDRLAIQTNDNGQNNAFRKLFNYISGSNIDSTKINMTIPATQSTENGSKIMQFFLPSKYTKNNTPAPNDNQIKIVVIEQGYYAVIKYSGRLTDKNFKKKGKILKDYLLNDDIKIIGSAIKATYNGPFTLPLLRRNEAMYRVDWKIK